MRRLVGNLLMGFEYDWSSMSLSCLVELTMCQDSVYLCTYDFDGEYYGLQAESV